MMSAVTDLLPNRRARLGATVVLFVVIVALASPWLAPHDPIRQDLTATQLPPSPRHWLGTDALGRDEFSRMLVGARVAVTVGLGAAALSVVVGVLFGLTAGVLGGRIEATAMRVVDLLLAFPFLVAALFLVSLAGRSTVAVILVVAALSWPVVARLTRGGAVAVRDAPFVTASRLLGVPPHRVALRHVLPHALGPVFAYATLSVPAAIGAEAALSYLGVGVRLGQPDWGQMIADGQKYFGYRDQLWLAPSGALVVTTLGFVLLADGLSSRFGTLP